MMSHFFNDALTMENLQSTTQTVMSDALVLQALLADDTLWQVHSCRILNQIVQFDTPQSLLAHYNSLSDEVQANHPLTFDLLKRLDERMNAELAAMLIGVPVSDIRQAWQIKYVGRVVFFCESLKLALRLHFSNTAKPTQAVYVATQEQAWQAQISHWRTFGVVDVLYKGESMLVSHADDVLVINTSHQYQALPSSHSVAISSWINTYKEQMVWLNTAVCHALL